MCGIVGYLGNRDVKDVLINGLRTLEYRGYDSSGVSIFDNGKINRVRAAGKLSTLESKLMDKKFTGPFGIGHTRWATHGKATEQNAHPHTAQKISIVHNGIIENYLEIKEELLSCGTKLFSETDSELVAHLISREVDKGADLLQAVFTVKKKLRGAYAILVISEDEQGVIIGFKEGPPLLLGKNSEEFFFASDALAMVGQAKEVLYLNDGELAYLKNQEVTVFDKKDNKISDPHWSELNWSAEAAEKSGYDHFMQKEIFEQPNAFKNAIAPHIDFENHKVNLNVESGITEKDFAKYERIFIVACGTSYYAGMYGKYIIEKYARIPVELEIASEFRYKDPALGKNALVLVISQSGETADTLASVRLAKEKGVQVLSICNTRRSTIDREAHYKLYMNSGIEIGVASTKAFVCSLGLLSLFAMFLAKTKKLLSEDKESEYTKELLQTPAKMEAVLVHDKYFKEASKSFKDFKGYLYMGRGVHYPVALEGALKMKELAYKHAEGYAAGEMKHGPLALIDEQMLILMICPQDDLYEKTLSNLEEARARGGYIVSIGTQNDTKLEGLSDQFLGLPKGNSFTNPIIETLPVQLLAYHVSKALGNDVDQPRNLAKSVTVE